MKLTVKERYMLPSILPERGDITNQTLVRDIINKTSLSKKERKAYDVKRTPRGYTWNEEKAKAKKVDFTFSEIQLLKRAIEELDRGKK